MQKRGTCCEGLLLFSHGLCGQGGQGWGCLELPLTSAGLLRLLPTGTPQRTSWAAAAATEQLGWGLVHCSAGSDGKLDAWVWLGPQGQQQQHSGLHDEQHSQEENGGRLAATGCVLLQLAVSGGINGGIELSGWWALGAPDVSAACWISGSSSACVSELLLRGQRQDCRREQQEQQEQQQWIALGSSSGWVAVLDLQSGAVAAAAQVTGAVLQIEMVPRVAIGRQTLAAALAVLHAAGQAGSKMQQPHPQQRSRRRRVSSEPVSQGQGGLVVTLLSGAGSNSRSPSVGGAAGDKNARMQQFALIKGAAALVVPGGGIGLVAPPADLSSEAAVQEGCRVGGADRAVAVVILHTSGGGGGEDSGEPTCGGTDGGEPVGERCEVLLPEDRGSSTGGAAGRLSAVCLMAGPAEDGCEGDASGREDVAAASTGQGGQVSFPAEAEGLGAILGSLRSLWQQGGPCCSGLGAFVLKCAPVMGSDCAWLLCTSTHGTLHHTYTWHHALHEQAWQIQALRIAVFVAPTTLQAQTFDCATSPLPPPQKKTRSQAAKTLAVSPGQFQRGAVPSPSPPQTSPAWPRHLYSSPPCKSCAAAGAPATIA
jgi:hypothetical protein